MFFAMALCKRPQADIGQMPTSSIQTFQPDVGSRHRPIMFCTVYNGSTSANSTAPCRPSDGLMLHLHHGPDGSSTSAQHQQKLHSPASAAALHRHCNGLIPRFHHWPAAGSTSETISPASANGGMMP